METVNRITSVNQNPMETYILEQVQYTNRGTDFKTGHTTTPEILFFDLDVTIYF